MDKVLPIKHIYISNISEDVWPFIKAISDQNARQAEIDENAYLSDRDLMANAKQDHTLVILPQKIDPLFIKYYQKLFGVKNVTIVSPAKHTGKVCLDVLKDPQLLSYLKSILKASIQQKISLESYTVSSCFFDLYEKLKIYHPQIKLTSSPRLVDLWTINFFGSKSGIRQLAQISDDKPEFKMASGFIAVDPENAVKIASNINLFKKCVVIKTNKGHAGIGVLIYKKNDLPEDYYACEKFLSKIFKQDNYWQKFPIIIEDYVSPQFKIGGGFPNAEFRVLGNGQVKLLYYCGMRVTPEGVFKGVEINQGVLPDNITARILDIGFYIGERLSQFGYRGYYDVDFIVDHKQNLFVTESNVRRTGGTHVYHIIRALFGPHFIHKTYCLSNNLYRLPNQKKLNLKKLLQILTPILFDPKTKSGLIITSASLLNQFQFGYLIFAKNKTKAYQIEDQMESLLH